MLASRMSKGATIGMFCPSHVADMERYASIISAIKRLGYNVKLSENFQKGTYGYAASAEERAADLNSLAADDDVNMILFSGGDGAAEILPLIDYKIIRKNPKLYSSYSDGTSILNAIYAQTGLVTYYGWGASQFDDLRYYDYTQFCTHFVDSSDAGQFISVSKWKTLRGGNCAGRLIGGYSPLFALMLANKYFRYSKDKRYVLFLEDHEKFSTVGAVGSCLAFIEQTAFIRNVDGLIFGHYSMNPPGDLLRCLERFGARNGIPVVYTDDFGHGTKHAILPIGVDAELDADKQSLGFVGYH